MNCPNCGKEIVFTHLNEPGCGNPECSASAYRKQVREGKLTLIREQKIVEHPPVELENGVSVARDQGVVMEEIGADFICVGCLQKAIASAQQSLFYHVTEFMEGAFYGDFDADPDSAAQIAGQVVGGLVPISDLRDLVANGYNLYAGKVGVWEGLSGIGLALVGAVPLVGDTIKSAAQASKGSAKVVKGSTKIQAGALAFVHREAPLYARNVAQIGSIEDVDSLVKGIRERLDYRKGGKLSADARKALEKKLNEFEKAWARFSRPDGEVKKGLEAALKKQPKTTEDWAKIHNMWLQTGPKGDLNELVHMRELLDDEQIVKITHFDTGGHGEKFDIDFGYVRRQGKKGEHIFHDQVKAYTSKFGGDEMNTVKESLQKMKAHVLEFHKNTKESVKARFIVAGSPQELTPEKIREIEALVAKYNEELTYDVPAYAKGAGTPQIRGEPKGKIELVVRHLQPTGSLRQLVKENYAVGDRRQRPSPRCSCTFRMVHLNPLFPCVGNGSHDWVYRQSLTDQIGKAPWYECTRCGKFMMRGIVSAKGRYYEDESTMKKLDEAHRELNKDLICPSGGPHKFSSFVKSSGFEPAGFDYATCIRCSQTVTVRSD